MQRNRLIITAAAAAFFFAPAVSAKPQLTTDMAHNVNFADYKTFNFARTHPQGGINSVQFQNIISGVSSRLAAKGYQHHTPSDLTMAVTVGKRQKVEPRQIVGAIANEGGLGRQDFGHIDIRADHSIVELPADLPAGALERLRSTRISGQLIELTPDDGRAPRKPRH